MTQSFNAVHWMDRNGHPEYADQINALRCIRSETIGEAGRYWQHCQFTQATLAKIDAEIADIEERAYERYNDWATD